MIKKENESDVRNIDFELSPLPPKKKTKQKVCLIYSWQIGYAKSFFSLENKLTNSYVTLFWNLKEGKNVYISTNRHLNEMRFRSKCSIFQGQLIYTEKSQIDYCGHVTHSP